jgi:hypothetical protein
MHRPPRTRIVALVASLLALPAAGCQDILRDMVGVVPAEGVYRGTWELKEAEGELVEHEGHVSIVISATLPDVHGGLGIDGGHRFEDRINF